VKRFDVALGKRATTIIRRRRKRLRRRRITSFPFSAYVRTSKHSEGRVLINTLIPIKPKQKRRASRALLR